MSVAAHQLINQTSSDVEYYTPVEIIEAARRVMGFIDLDPASSESANKIVRAERIFTKDDNGLKRHWFGRVWLAPTQEGAVQLCSCPCHVGRFALGVKSQSREIYAISAQDLSDILLARGADHVSVNMIMPENGKPASFTLENRDDQAWAKGYSDARDAAEPMNSRWLTSALRSAALMASRRGVALASENIVEQGERAFDNRNIGGNGLMRNSEHLAPRNAGGLFAGSTAPSETQNVASGHLDCPSNGQSNGGSIASKDGEGDVRAVERLGLLLKSISYRSLIPHVPALSLPTCSPTVRDVITENVSPLQEPKEPFKDTLPICDSCRFDVVATFPSRIFMNHPFGRAEKACETPCVNRGKTHVCHDYNFYGNAAWINHLEMQYELRNVSEACCITYACTSEAWFQPLAKRPQCYLTPRTNYRLPDGTIKKGVSKGSVVTYYGEDVEKFAREFRAFGQVKIAI